MQEQGFTFTVIEGEQDDFTAARRVWLGAVPGTDWLHDAIAEEFGRDLVAYEVESHREAVNIGASGEIAAVVLVVLTPSVAAFSARFGGRLGEAAGDALLEWARERARRRREATGMETADPPPDLADRPTDVLTVGMQGELADLLGASEDRVELVHAERLGGAPILRAVYRDSRDGEHYEVAVERDSASFIKIRDGTLPGSGIVQRMRSRLQRRR